MKCDLSIDKMFDLSVCEILKIKLVVALFSFGSRW